MQRGHALGGLAWALAVAMSLLACCVDALPTVTPDIGPLPVTCADPRSAFQPCTTFVADASGLSANSPSDPAIRLNGGSACFQPASSAVSGVDSLQVTWFVELPSSLLLPIGEESDGSAGLAQGEQRYMWGLSLVETSTVLDNTTYVDVHDEVFRAMVLALVPAGAASLNAATSLTYLTATDTGVFQHSQSSVNAYVTRYRVQASFPLPPGRFSCSTPDVVPTLYTASYGDNCTTEVVQNTTIVTLVNTTDAMGNVTYYNETMFDVSYNTSCARDRSTPSCVDVTTCEVPELICNDTALLVNLTDTYVNVSCAVVNATQSCCNVTACATTQQCTPAPLLPILTLEQDATCSDMTPPNHVYSCSVAESPPPPSSSPRGFPLSSAEIAFLAFCSLVLAAIIANYAVPAYKAYQDRRPKPLVVASVRRSQQGRRSRSYV